MLAFENYGRLYRWFWNISWYFLQDYLGINIAEENREIYID